MKTKLLLSFLLLLFIPFGANARHITEEEAMAKAKLFVNNSNLKSSHKGLLKLTHKDISSKGANYYVFSKGENAGYVIVSGSDKTDAIFGYVDNGNFELEKLPSNVAYWLGEYSKQVDIAEACGYVARFQPKVSVKVVEPLLGTVKWNQDSPYNDKCPVLKNGTRTAAGCVATAFSQVMYYYKWPETGEGSHSYISTNNRFKLSADFGATTYRWDLMEPYYGKKSSAESKDAVAELIFHVGVGCNMNYGLESGAVSRDAAAAMANYFRYDKRISVIFRDFYSRDEWDAIIRNELESNRPVPYAGMAEDGGHQFVVDGCDANGMFHVNWGWGGYCDGYFKLSVLNPEGQGIGGYQGGYNSSQNATVNMMKPDPLVVLPEYASFDGQEISVNITSVKQGTEFDYTVKQFWNDDFRTFNGYLTAGLFNSKDELVVPSSYVKQFSIKSDYGWGQTNFRAKFTGLPDGTYKLYPIEKKNNSSKWIRSRLKNTTNTVYVTVKGENMKFENVAPKIDLKVTDIKIGESYEGFKTNITYKLVNNGDFSEIPLRVGVCKSADDLNTLYAGDQIITPIAKGETITVETVERFRLDAGSYVLAVINEEGLVISDLVPFEILPKPPVEDVHVTSIDAKSEYTKDNFSFNVKIINNGGFYISDVVVFIYEGTEQPQSADLGNYVDRFTIPDVRMPGKGTEIELPVKAALRVSEGNYYTWPSYKASDGRLILLDKGFAFRLVDEAGIETVNADSKILSIYPNPVEDVLHLKSSAAVENVYIYNMQGVTVKESHESEVNVSDLIPGNYLVKVMTDKGMQVEHFIKK